MTASVTCVGMAVLDLVLEVDALPSHPGKWFASDAREVGGGPAATAAVTLARLGGDARLLGWVGSDARGERLRELLTRAGVDASGVEAASGMTTPTSAVLVTPDGERTIVNHAPPELLTADRPLPSLGEPGAVLADVRWASGAHRALAEARRRDIPGVLDLDRAPRRDRDEILAAAAAASCVVASRPGLADVTGQDDLHAGLDALADRTAAAVAVTTGADGVWWKTPAGIAHLPAPKVEVRDTLGAGDVFHGALTLALAERRPLTEALRFASAAAALSCERPSGWEHLPTRHEVDRLEEETRWS